jgi:hypothetical protein
MKTLKQLLGKANEVIPTKKERDYAYEYARDQASPKQIKARSLRNKARKILGLEVGDPRECDHIKPLSKGGSNKKENLRAVSIATNRKKGNTIVKKD